MMDEDKPRKGVQNVAQALDSRQVPSDEDQIANEKVSDASHETDLEMKIKNESLQNSRSIRIMREVYTKRILWFLCACYVVVLILVVLSGFNLDGFNLHYMILVVMVSTTTLSVMALLGFIVKGLFQPNKPVDSLRE